MPNRFDPQSQRQAVRNVLLRMPKICGDMAVQFFKSRFQEQGWRDRGFTPWAKRGPKAKRNSGRAILIDRARLRRSIRITSINGPDVTIGSDVPYARAHNEGFKGSVMVQQHQRNRYKKTKQGTGKFTAKGKERMRTVTSVSGTHTVRAHSRKMNMPKRQFMGESAHLNRVLGHKIRTSILKALS